MATRPFVDNTEALTITAPPIRLAMAPIAASPAAADVLLIQPDASAQKGPFIEYAPISMMLRITMVAERDADKGGKYTCGNHEKGQSGMPAAFIGSVRTASPHNHQYGCQTVRNGIEQDPSPDYQGGTISAAAVTRR